MGAPSVGVSRAVVAAVVAVAFGLPGAAVGQTPFPVAWSKQVGSTAFDGFTQIATEPGGGVYVAGRTGGDFATPSFGGGADGFLAKYNSQGTEMWRRQIGTAEFDVATGVSVDAAGNAYITGITAGDLDGTNAGDWDLFVAKYSPVGDELWRTQFGGVGVDSPSGIVSDYSGNTYVTGRSDNVLLGQTPAGGQDAFLMKFDPDGEPVWNRYIGQQFQDLGSAVALDVSGAVYLVGGTSGALPGQTHAGGGDYFIAKYTPNGDQVWVTQHGSSQADRGFDITVDGLGSVYVAGDTLGDLDGANAGGLDGFVSKFDATGAHVWTHQIGAAEEDQAQSVVVDAGLRVFVAGNTLGELATPIAGSRDSFLMQLNSSGAQQWATQFGSTNTDDGADLALDGANNVYLTNTPRGSFAGPLMGSADFAIVKFDSNLRLAGDYNDDGLVNAADYTVWRDAFDAGVTGYSPADGDGSGTVDELDKAFWEQWYGRVGLYIPPGQSAAAGVPEPGGLVLLAIAGAAYGWRGRPRSCGSPRLSAEEITVKEG